MDAGRNGNAGRDARQAGAPGGDAGRGGPRAGAAARPVLAAGCALWRRSATGEGIELALVHRPKWDDWSLPKGKLKRREDAREGAVREVLEETGMTCAPGPELPTVRYLVDGRPKQVRYWAAEATGGGFLPNKEVDRMVWLPPAAARRVLTHDHDRRLVDALLEALHAS